MEQEKKIRLKGHETFILREGWLTKGLLEVKKDKKVFSKNFGTDAFGVGANMAKAIRYWLRESGLMEESKRAGTKLTELGEILLEEDVYFEDDFSLWLLHCNLAANKENVTSWYLFFNQLESQMFSREELEKEITERLFVYAETDSVSLRSIKDDCAAILAMYVWEKTKDCDPEDKRVSPFAHLGLLCKNRKGYQKSVPNLDTLSPELLLYVLAKYQETTGEKSISIEEMMHGENLPAKILHLNRVVLNRYLEQLANENVLTLNRTAGLDMVYFSGQSSLEIIRTHYQKGKNHGAYTYRD